MMKPDSFKYSFFKLKKKNEIRALRKRLKFII